MSQRLEPGNSTAMPLNVSYRLRTISAHAPISGRWLDYGCADGGYAQGLLDHGASEVVGVDVEADRVERAGERGLDRARFACLVPPDYRIPLPDDSVDGVLVNEVLEHVDDEHAVLVEIRRVLRPGGVLALLSPNRYFPVDGHGITLAGGRMKLSPMPLVPWLPARLSRRVLRARNYWPHELRDLVASAGFAVDTVDQVLPVLEEYPWAPAPLVRAYQRNLAALHRVRPLRRFGVSTLVVAHPAGSAAPFPRQS